MRRLADWLIGCGLGVLTLVVSAYWAPRGFHLGFTDMGHDGYQLRQALDLSGGAVIFRDTFDQYGPLNGYFNTIGFLTLGHRLLAIKFFLCGWYGLTAALLYMTARRWLSPPVAAFSVLIWLGLAPFYQHGVMISPHVYVLAVQSLALLILLQTDADAIGPLVVAGTLIGLSWAFKQVMGSLFLGAATTFFLLLAVTKRISWRSAARAAAALVAGFTVVVAGTLAVLWAAGALPDWYRQTIAFPRAFYFVGDHASTIGASLSLFVTMQRTAASYWWIMRVVVLGAGVVAFARRSASRDALLLALVTGALWPATFSSANFMHQWWTLSLSMTFFVAVVSQCAGLLVRRSWIRDGLTIVAVFAIVVFGLAERFRTGRAQAASLTATIDTPAVLRGIRTTPAAKLTFAAIEDTMKEYRSTHPGAHVVSIDDEIEPSSLPFLSFLPDNPHSSPVYWSAPMLATAVYPGYLPALAEEIAQSHPLIVDHQVLSAFSAKAIPGYALRLAAASTAGYWYLYAPVEQDSASRAVFLNWDGHAEPLPTDASARAAVVEQANNWNTHGGLSDKTKANGADLYTFPGALSVGPAAVEGPLDAIDVAPSQRATAVTQVARGGWAVDGRVDDRYSYLLQFPATTLKKGATFVARGIVRDGGLSLGFTQADGRWNGVVNVTKAGPFVVVLQVPSAGKYAVTVANCVEAPWRSTLGLVTDRFLENHATITAAGWLR